MIKIENCVLCGSAALELISRQGMFEKSKKPIKFNNTICKNCGMIFINPRPEEGDYRNIYARYENSRYGCDDKEGAVKIMEEKFSKSILTEPIYNFVKEYLSGEKKVLDIGCGFGHLSNAFKNIYGCNVSAVEPSGLLSELVRDKYGVDVWNGEFDDFLKNHPQKFNLLILSHVFEHFVDPVNKLEQMKELLLPNGVIYIEVPNAVFFKRPINYFFDFCHPFSYSPKTFKQMADKGGYKIIKVDKRRKYHLGVIIAPVKSSYDAINDAYLEQGSYVDIKRYIRTKKVIDAIKAIIIQVRRLCQKPSL